MLFCIVPKLIQPTKTQNTQPFPLNRGGSVWFQGCGSMPDFPLVKGGRTCVSVNLLAARFLRDELPVTARFFSVPLKTVAAKVLFVF